MLWLLLATVLGCMTVACSSDQSGAREIAPEQVGSLSEALTSVIPTSASCVRGRIGPSFCVGVPPVSGKGRKWVIDGLKGQHEYDGAFAMSYVNTELFTQGRVHVQALRRKGWMGPGGRMLYVFLKGIPVAAPPGEPSNIGGTPDARLPGRIAVLVDHERFEGQDHIVSTEDRAYVLQLSKGTLEGVYHPIRKDPQPPDWVPLIPLPGTGPLAEFRSHGCVPDSSTAAVLRCDAELAIPLPASAFESPGGDLRPGIGFAVLGMDEDFRGGLPEALGKFGTIGYSISTRTQWQTLLFRPALAWSVVRGLSRSEV